MEILKDLEVSTDDFWYDLADVGYLNPYAICAKLEDANKVADAIEVLEKFKQACESQIEGFIR